MNVPGGIAIVALEATTNYPPTAFYNNQRTLIIAHESKPNVWRAIVGIPLDVKPGLHYLEVVSSNGIEPVEFYVQSKTYPREKLKIRNHRKVQPLPEDLPLIEAQYLETIRSYENWEYRDLESLVLQLPTEGRRSSPFGLQRIMNNIPQNPHSGLDIAAPKGTPVIAPKSGKVINTGDYFYSGKIVFLDHGQGFITSYCHLDTVAVTTGQEVQQGEVLGTVGNTGRATGPHLHWSVSLNGVRVNPELFVYE
jgi:murein DD-endopeptidase MepM/ murein hydrolase activator NlpD